MDQHFSVRSGLKRFGDQGEKDLSKELTKIHNMHKYYPVYPKKLTKKLRMDLLSSLMFLIDKRNGDVKAQSCDDGSKQRKLQEIRCYITDLLK